MGHLYESLLVLLLAGYVEDLVWDVTHPWDVFRVVVNRGGPIVLGVWSRF